MTIVVAMPPAAMALDEGSGTGATPPSHVIPPIVWFFPSRNRAPAIPVCTMFGAPPRAAPVSAGRPA